MSILYPDINDCIPRPLCGAGRNSRQFIVDGIAGWGREFMNKIPHPSFRNCVRNNSNYPAPQRGQGQPTSRLRRTPPREENLKPVASSPPTPGRSAPAGMGVTQ